MSLPRVRHIGINGRLSSTLGGARSPALYPADDRARSACPAELGPKRADRLGLAGQVEVTRQLDEVQIRKERASLCRPVLLAGEKEHVDPSTAPDPELGDAETAVDLELVDEAARPLDLDGEIRPLLRLGVAEDVALVRLEATLLGLRADRPRAESFELELALLRVGLDEPTDER